MISNQAIDAERQIIEMAYNSVRKKVANALIAFATHATNQDSEAIRLINQGMT